jgi:hypothetical protein
VRGAGVALACLVLVAGLAGTVLAGYLWAAGLASWL